MSTIIFWTCFVALAAVFAYLISEYDDVDPV